MVPDTATGRWTTVIVIDIRELDRIGTTRPTDGDPDPR